MGDQRAALHESAHGPDADAELGGSVIHGQELKFGEGALLHGAPTGEDELHEDDPSSLLSPVSALCRLVRSCTNVWRTRPAPGPCAANPIARLRSSSLSASRHNLHSMQVVLLVSAGHGMILAVVPGSGNALGDGNAPTTMALA